jgi:hypothetical protein
MRVARGKKKKNRHGREYLHLRAAVLEPELDLARVEAEPPAELAALLLVRVRALLEEPTQRNTGANPCIR